MAEDEPIAHHDPEAVKVGSPVTGMFQLDPYGFWVAMQQNGSGNA